MAHLLNTTFLPSSSASPFRRSSIPSQYVHISSRTTQVQAKIREIFMPALRSTMTEGKIVSWIKSEGDKLSKGESVVVVESDKADMDVETFYDGYLAAIMVEEGGVAAVGSAIALLAETEDEIAEARSKASPSSSSSPAPLPPAPELPQTETIAGPQTSKTADVVASAVHPASEGGRRVVASPYAKKLVKELKVELGNVAGSGPMGRIVAKDVEAAAAATINESVSASAKVGTTALSPPGIELGTVVPLTTMQGAVSRNMVESLGVPTFRVGYTITTDALDALYKKVDIYSLSRKWKELVDKARAKQLQPHEYNTESSRILLNSGDDEHMKRLLIWGSAFSYGQISLLISAQEAQANGSIKINELYEVGALFELGIQLSYLLLLLGLLGVGTFFVIRQVLVRRELDLSAKELQEQVRSGDASATELFELGAVMLRRKFYPAATKYLLQAIEKWDGDDQDLAQVYNALGVSYTRDGKLDKGIKQFETAVKIQPGYVTAWNNLGDAYEKKKELKGALRAFEEVLLFDPNNKIARPRRDALKDRVEMYKGIPVKSKDR